MLPLPSLTSPTCISYLQLSTQPFIPANAVRLVGGYDLVVDASDNPATRYLLNDACVLLPSLLPEGGSRRRGRGRVPLVSGAAVGAEGQVCRLIDRVIDIDRYQYDMPRMLSRPVHIHI